MHLIEATLAFVAILYAVGAVYFCFDRITSTDFAGAGKVAYAVIVIVVSLIWPLPYFIQYWREEHAGIYRR
jgi:hypothetical protein